MNESDLAEPSLGRRSINIPTLVLVCALFLCAFVPLVVVSNTADDGDPSWRLALVVVVVAGARFAWLFGFGRARLMEFSFWIFTYVFMGLAPLMQLRSSTYPGTTNGLTLDLNAPAMLVVIVGVVAVLLGLCAPPTSAGGPQRPQSLNANRIIGLAVFSLIFNFYYVSLVGPSVFFESRAALSSFDFSANPAVDAVVGSLARVPLLISFLALLAVRRRAAPGSRRVLALLAVLTCSAALFTVNPISSPRYIFGTFALSMLAGLGAYATATRVRTMSFGFLVGLVGLFPVADLFRRSAVATVDLATDANPLLTLTTGDFDAYGQLNNTLLYVNEAGITWGRQALGVLLFWVPRDVWAAKPIDTGTLLAQFRGYTFGNLSAPLWAEFYINFGIIGVVLGMFILGCLMRRSDTRTSILLSERHSPSLIALILPFYLIMVLRGSLLQAMAFLTVMTVCALLVRNGRTGYER